VDGGGRTPSDAKYPLKRLGAKHTGESPARSRPELVAESAAARQAHFGEPDKPWQLPE